ncbi:MAG: type II toxin-antitoxin system Phd/YefM family antitoxin [Gemmatimonadota bacterium]
MRDVTTAEARKNLADLLNRVAYSRERVVVTRHGREIAAIVPVEDLNLLDRLRDALSRSDAEDALRELAEGESVSWTALRDELDR